MLGLFPPDSAKSDKIQLMARIHAIYTHRAPFYRSSILSVESAGSFSCIFWTIFVDEKNVTLSLFNLFGRMIVITLSHKIHGMHAPSEKISTPSQTRTRLREQNTSTERQIQKEVTKKRNNTHEERRTKSMGFDFRVSAAVAVRHCTEHEYK